MSKNNEVEKLNHEQGNLIINNTFEPVKVGLQPCVICGKLTCMRTWFNVVVHDTCMDEYAVKYPERVNITMSLMKCQHNQELNEMSTSIIEENKQLIKKLNELMANDIITKLVDKPFPYLGWYWRGIDDFEAEGMHLSYADGKWCIDEAGKWSYPSKRINAEQVNQLLKICINIAEATLQNSGAYQKFSDSLGQPEQKENH